VKRLTHGPTVRPDPSEEDFQGARCVERLPQFLGEAE
jgi:hypothetical protein